MDKLFTTRLDLDQQAIDYDVTFSNENYTFHPAVDAPGLPTFSFIRKNDEWHEQQTTEAGIKKQALDALESYLLSQH
jgi:hypothetical protein